MASKLQPTLFQYMTRRTLTVISTALLCAAGLTLTGNTTTSADTSAVHTPTATPLYPRGGIGVYEWRRLDTANPEKFVKQLSKSPVPIDHVALELTNLLDAEDGRYLGTARNNIATYVRKLDRKGVQVRGLTGELRMLEEPQRAVEVCKAVGRYNTAKPKRAITWLEYDIEPHSQGTGWEKDIPAMLTVFDTLQQQCPTNIRIGASIPYWYRMRTHNNEQLDIAVGKRVDFLVTMAYRSYVYGTGGVNYERKYAAATSAQLGIPYTVSVDYKSVEWRSYLKTPEQLQQAARDGAVTVNSSYTLLLNRRDKHHG